MSIIVYRYGLLSPTTNADLVFGQLRRAHAYRNLLTEIERERRKALGAIVEDGVRELGEIYKGKVQVLDALRHTLRLERVRGRSRRVEAEALKVQIDNAKREKNEALYTYKGARRAHLERLRSERDRIDGLALELRKGARAMCDVYWGSYLLCEDADLASRKAPLFDGDEIHLPRFLKWNGTGQLGVQIQKGMEVSELDSEDETRLRIVPRAMSKKGEPWDPKRSPWGKLLRMRVGSTPNAQPIFAEWPMKMHRPLPENAIIKRAAVTRMLIGPREEWSVIITVDTTLSPPRHATPRDGSAVAVDLGWRVFDDVSAARRTEDRDAPACRHEGAGKEIRTGMYVDDRGHVGEIRLSAYDVSGLTKANELRSVRDKELEVFRKKVTAWRGELTSAARRTEDRDESALEQWVKRTDYVWSWRAPSRFAGLVHWWREHRLVGDDAMFLEAEAWRRQDKHLWAWETSQRTGALRHRKDMYRVFARKLAQRYEWLVLEDFNIAKKIARVPDVEGVDSEQNERARSYRQLASPSELRLCLFQAFGGAARLRIVQSVQNRTLIAEGAFTTCTCHVCGLVERFDAAKDLKHRCGGCGSSWDQDDNACRNLIEQWRVQHGGGSARNDEAAKYEGKWQRAKKKRKEREQSEGTAREAPANVSD